MDPRITFLEELSLNAWPGHHTVLYDGWLLRFSEGYTQRANSINPLYNGHEPDLYRKIQTCEECYTSKGLPTVFKLTPASVPSNLDEVLNSLGYAKFEPVSIQAVALDELQPFLSDTASPGEDSHVFRESQLKPDWLLAWLHLTNISIGHWANVEKLLGNILPSHCFLRLEEAGQTMAVGLAVYERGYVGLFDIVTNPAFRRQGWGRRLVVELLRWGQAQGANTAYLQVATPNTAALQLYAGFGFREVYRYWYRVKALAKV
ncbi:MAG: GNAT family N-acetyltransferase [Chloroflexi bacterium]|nr:GNAT family N-acetyltransferase [Chloroflexota bacterium]OJV91112.1 MAG: hypothetical protein BGO39_26345 [Chloroflexi bacterium 54-19]